MSHNKNYLTEIGRQEPALVVGRTCPHCESRLGVIYPDRAWCINSECNYGELHIIGCGVRRLKLEPISLEKIKQLINPDDKV